MVASNLNRFNQVVVPIYELNEKGYVKPNPLFHRPIDKLHSRCIEYPFAASRVGDAKSILDVGTVKSDPVWISWLEHLPAEVHAADYDEPYEPFTKVRFHQSDIRQLPLPDGIFDKVIAVSVIEHIGLEFAQVLADTVPCVNTEGDLEAVRELARLLKPGGELIMTVPFGMKDELILGDQARSYTIDSIRKFELVLDLAHIEYYEYQNEDKVGVAPTRAVFSGLRGMIFEKIVRYLNRLLDRTCVENKDIPGEVTWRNVPLDQTRASHKYHVEGVACGVWKKRKKN